MVGSEGRAGPEAAAGGVGFVQRIGLWLSLLLTAGIALPRLFTTSVSIDEAYSMDTAGRSLAGTLHQSIHFELQPPLYFLLLNLWLRLSRSPEFARFLSLGCVLFALVVLSRVGRRLGGGWGLALLPLLTALLAPVAWSAITVRGYALALLLLAVCACGFANLWWDDREPPRWALPAFILAGGAAIYTFYYSGFAIAGLVVAAAMSGRRRRELLTAVALLTLLVLPLLPAVRMQFASPSTAAGKRRGGQTMERRIRRTCSSADSSGRACCTARRGWSCSPSGSR